MTHEQIKLVQESFRRFEPQAHAIAESFYKRLHEIEPDMQTVIPEDIEEQKELFVSLLAFAVATLERLDVFAPALEELGRWCVRVGICPEDYERVADAFLTAISETLDGETRPLRTLRAWHAMFWTIAGVMIDAACRLSRRRSVPTFTAADRLGRSISRSVFILKPLPVQ